MFAVPVNALFPGRLRGPVFLLLVLCLAGCSINPKVDLAELSSHTAPVKLAVPFFPQTEYQCGPAALATILSASGVDTTPEQLAPQIYLPERQGSLQLELLAATRRAGRVPYVIRDNRSALFAEVESGHPVLVLQNLQTPHFPQWHYAVMTGFDVAAGEVFLNTGVTEQQPMDAGKFARLWDWAGNWALVTARPDEIPVSAVPAAWFEAVANFEAVAGAENAAPAWRAAALKWPEESQPYLALGNQAYSTGDLDGAVVLYRQGLNIEGDNVGLANNLASVLGEMGCPREGEQLLQPLAHKLGMESGWYEIVQATLAELSAPSNKQSVDCTQDGGTTRLQAYSQ
jgi:hypothetical protein